MVIVQSFDRIVVAPVVHGVLLFAQCVGDSMTAGADGADQVEDHDRGEEGTEDAHHHDGAPIDGARLMRPRRQFFVLCAMLTCRARRRSDRVGLALAVTAASSTTTSTPGIHRSLG